MDSVVDNSLARTTKGTRAATIAEILGDEIHHGAIPPDTKLTEEVLAERFNVSRGPVRDAIRLLERDGLVKVRPHLGAMVPKLTLGELSDLYEIRVALFSVAVRLFAQKWKDGTLSDDIRARFRSHANSIFGVKDASAREFAERTQAFSDFIQKHCGNARLCEEMRRLNRQSYLFYVELGHQNLDHRGKFLAFGEMMIDAVMAEEPDLAGDIAAKLVAANQKAVCAEFARYHPESKDG